MSLVAYDDAIQVLAKRQAPCARIANIIDRMGPGASTDLYGGWVTGAKLLHPGGRVTLLSDGHANVGRFVEANDLAAHAGLSHDRYRVVKSTIGVGENYDEALMAGMARKGSRAHDFAHTAEAIGHAFANERYAMGSSIVGFVSVRRGADTILLGQFWPGEVKRVAFRITSLTAAPTTTSYLVPGDEHSRTVELKMPDCYGLHDEATLQLLAQEAVDLEADAVAVRDRESATWLHGRVREFLLRLISHALADSNDAVALRERLHGSLARLEQLRVEYREDDAMMQRNRSLQSSFNLREKARAFSSSEDEKELLMMEHAAAMRHDTLDLTRVDESLLALAPFDQWKAWCAAPIHGNEDWVIVAAKASRDGFLAEELERTIGRRVRLVQLDEHEITPMLDEAKKPR